MDKVESSNRGATATPQGIKPGAMTNDSIDTADSNDAGAGSPATASSDKPDNKPIKSKTNSRDLLIDGEDRVEDIREQTTTRTAAVKEVETPAQAPHEEGMKIADDGAEVISGQANQNQANQTNKPGVMLIDGTDTIENIQTGSYAQPDSTINTYAENVQEYYSRLRREADAAGKDLITYYYEQKKAELAAANPGGTATPADMAKAIRESSTFLQVVSNYNVLTEAEISLYKENTNGDATISITGNGQLISRYNSEVLEAVVAQARAAGRNETQIQGLLAAMVRNPGSFFLTSNFNEYQKVFVKGYTDKSGVYHPPYYYECLGHSGVDITNINTTESADNDLVSIFFMDVIQNGASSITLGITGTNVHVTIMHLDSNDVSKAVAQGSFTPGDTIATYPDNNNGASSGLHYHIEVTDLVNGTREFVNPMTLEHAPLDADFRYRYGKIEQVISPQNDGNLSRHYLFTKPKTLTGYDYMSYWWSNTRYFSKPNWGDFEETDSNVICWSDWISANRK